MNVAGTVSTNYAGCCYQHAVGTAQGGTEAFFAMDSSFDGDFRGSYLGIGFFEEESGRQYGICAEYAKSSTKEHPVVTVTVHTEHGQEVYEIDIKKVRPEHATELEMFALCSYADDNGMGVDGNLSTWQTLQHFKEDAVRNGYMQDPAQDEVADWQTMVNRVRRDYCSAGMIGEYHNGQKINAMFDNFEDRITFGGVYIFRMPCVEQASAEERELGTAFLRYSEESTFGLKAEYVKNASQDYPIVKVTVHDNGQEKEHYVNLKDVNARHATEIEMFALVSYMDANGFGTEFSVNTWQRLKELRKDGFNRGYCGEISKDIEEVGLENVKMDWMNLLEKSAEGFRHNGNSQGVMECEDLLEKLDTVTSNEAYMKGKEFTAADGETVKQSERAQSNEQVNIYEKIHEDKPIGEYTTEELIERIREEIDKIREKVKNGDTEVSFQIGGASFTIKEWDKMLEKFDTVQDAIREQMREEIAKRNGKKVKEYNESRSVLESSDDKAGSAGIYEIETNDAKTDVLVESLVTESTVSTYSYEGEPERKFITWYTEEGICCREEGQTEGYYYKINFDNPKQYREVMDFLGKLSEDADLSFTANKHFWRDFLNGTLDKEEFLSFINNNQDGNTDKQKEFYEKFLDRLNGIL